jgi:hypothetical protein
MGIFRERWLPASYSILLYCRHFVVPYFLVGKSTGWWWDPGRLADILYPVAIDLLEKEKKVREGPRRTSL